MDHQQNHALRKASGTCHPTRFMDTQQQINFALFRAFESRGIEFAYPTQTIHTATTAAD